MPETVRTRVLGPDHTPPMARLRSRWFAPFVAFAVAASFAVAPHGVAVPVGEAAPLRALAPPRFPAPGPVNITSLADRIGEGAMSATGLRGPFGTLSSRADAPSSGERVPPWEGESAMTPLALETRLRIETPRWYGDFAPLPDAGADAFVRVHGYGAVYAMEDPARTLWDRPAGSFYRDWGVDLRRVPAVLMGNAPTSPFSAPENPFAVADFTGDGHDDVAVSHYVVFGANSAASFVTVLDGRDGSTAWWRQFPGAITAVIGTELDPNPGHELVLANERTDAPSAIHALSLEGSPPSERELWSYEAVTSAVFMHVEASPVSNEPRIAASWSAKNFGAPAPKGTLVLLGADGSKVWEKATTGWIRTFRFDASTSTIVGQEMDDAPSSYSIRALSVADGSQVASIPRTRSLMTRMALGDADSDGAVEWAVSELVVDQLNRWTATRVSVLEANGSTRWTWEIPAEGNLEIPHGLAIVPGERPVVVVGSTKTHGDLVQGTLSLWGTRLLALDGRASGSGSIAWDLGDRGAFPLFIVAHRLDGDPAVLVGTDGLGARAYDPFTGAKLADVEVLAEPYAVVARDLDDDGVRDLLAGGGSGVVFAYDGRSALEGAAVPLWATGVNGQVHEIRLGDLDGDGVPEAVVAAGNQVAALRLADGATLWTFDRPNSRPVELFWTVGIGDLNGDGRGDVAVPGQRLIALNGTDGSVLWSYEPVGGGNPSNLSTVALADANGDGALDVASEYTVDYPAGLAARHVVGVVLANGKTGAPLWEHRLAFPRNIPQLWRTVNVYPGPDGPEFAFTYLMGQNNGVSALGAWYPRVDVYDGSTGTLDWTSGTFPQGYQHTKTALSPRGGDELFDFNWLGITRVSASGVAETDTKSLFDGEFASLLPGEDHLVVAGEGVPPSGILPNGNVEVYPASLAWGPGGDGPEPLAWWGDDGSEEVEVADLDGDGDDEIVTMPFDFDAWIKVLFFEGIGVGRGDSSFHGLSVVDGVPAGG